MRVEAKSKLTMRKINVYCHDNGHYCYLGKYINQLIKIKTGIGKLLDEKRIVKSFLFF